MNIRASYVTTNSGAFSLSQSFSGSVPVSNPGDTVVNVIELTFGSHLNVTDFSFDASSVNTRGTAWEVSYFELLDVNGNLFSSTPVINSYLTHTEINGSPSIGVFVADSRGSVNGVGTGLTSSGSSGIHNNLSSTVDLDYSDFGLAVGTQISGLRFTTRLEDVRGVDNNASNFTSSLIDFSFSGTIDQIPEPQAFVFIIIGGCVSIFIRRRH